MRNCNCKCKCCRPSTIGLYKALYGVLEKEHLTKPHRFITKFLWFPRLTPAPGGWLWLRTVVMEQKPIIRDVVLGWGMGMIPQPEWKMVGVSLR